MCGSCGGDFQTGGVNERVLASNGRAAGRNRDRFREHQVAVVNVMGGPGSGKTSLLEATARALGGRANIGVLTGDVSTGRDAARLRAAGVMAESIITGSASHLDAEMVHRALHHLPWRDLDILFIENVGNLVCPALYDLGQSANVVLLSVTEGDDKPLKYPTIFQKADMVLLTKIDLLPQLEDITAAKIQEHLSLVMPQPAMIEVSAKDGRGIEAWARWAQAVGSTRASRCATAAGVF